MTTLERIIELTEDIEFCTISKDPGATVEMLNHADKPHNEIHLEVTHSDGASFQIIIPIPTGQSEDIDPMSLDPGYREWE